MGKLLCAMSIAKEVVLYIFRSLSLDSCLCCCCCCCCFVWVEPKQKQKQKQFARQLRCSWKKRSLLLSSSFRSKSSRQQYVIFEQAPRLAKKSMQIAHMFAIDLVVSKMNEKWPFSIPSNHWAQTYSFAQFVVLIYRLFSLTVTNSARYCQHTQTQTHTKKKPTTTRVILVSTFHSHFLNMRELMQITSLDKCVYK